MSREDVPPAGVEPATWWVEATRSIQLSYRGPAPHAIRTVGGTGGPTGRVAACATLVAPWWP